MIIAKITAATTTFAVMCRLNTVSLNVTWLPIPVVKPLNGSIRTIPTNAPNSDSSNASITNETLSSFFLVLSVISVFGMIPAGRFGGREVVEGLLMLPGVVIGFLLSRPFAAYLDRGYTRYVILGVSALAGILLIGQTVLH